MISIICSKAISNSINNKNIELINPLGNTNLYRLDIKVIMIVLIKFQANV